MSITVQTNYGKKNQATKFLDDPENFNEQGLDLMSEALRNSSNLDQFLNHINSASKIKKQKTLDSATKCGSEGGDQNIETISPVKRLSFSGGIVSPKSSTFRFFDPMQHLNSSDEDECTFQPKINANASRISKRNIPNVDTNQLLYKHAFDRKDKKQEYQEIEKMNREKIATKNKSDKKSMKIMLKKLRSALQNLVANAENSEAEGQLSFEGLGTVLYQIGLFQNLEFLPNENNGDKSAVSINQARVKPERLAREIAFHENLWNICSLLSKESKTIPSDFVLRLLIVFLEEKTPLADAAVLLQEMIDVALETNGMAREQDQSLYQGLAEEKKLWSLEKLIGEFRRLFDNKTSFMNIYATANLVQARNTFVTEKQYTYAFTPEINKKSKALDTRFFNDTLLKRMSLSATKFDRDSLKPRHARLYNYNSYLKDKKAIKLEARMEEELATCTFNPKITPYKKAPLISEVKDLSRTMDQSSMSPIKRKQVNKMLLEGNAANRHLLLYEVAKVYKEKLQLKSYAFKKKEEAKEMEQCTFQPNLNRKYESSPVRDQDFYDCVPNGFKKVVERLYKGEYQRQMKKTEMETIPRGENFEKNRDADFNPPNFLQRPKIKREEVLVYVDVSIGPGRNGRIGIHRGDNAKTLAKNFANTYSLNATMRESLEKLLQSYIDSYFAHGTHQDQETGRRDNNGQANYEDDEEEEDEEDEDEEEEEDGVDEADEEEEDN